MTLRAMLENHEGLRVHKYPHVMEVYERFFARVFEVPPTVVEIGVCDGGSLEIWRQYFGPAARIVGIDIADRTRLAARMGAEILIGDQGDPEFWKTFRELGIRPDIVIDDGSHRGHDQMLSLMALFPLLSEGGVYCIEDVHKSYDPEFAGAAPFTEAVKGLVDVLHDSASGCRKPEFLEGLFAVHVYPTLIVLEKRSEKTYGGPIMRGEEY